MSQAASGSTGRTIISNGPPESADVNFNSYDSSQQPRFGEDPVLGINPNLDTLTQSPEVLIAKEMRENIFHAFAMWLGPKFQGQPLDGMTATQWIEGLGETGRQGYWQLLCRFQEECNGWFHSPIDPDPQNPAPYVKYTDKTQDETAAQSSEQLQAEPEVVQKNEVTADKEGDEEAVGEADVAAATEVNAAAGGKGAAETTAAHVGTGAEEDPVVVDDDDDYEILDEDDEDEDEDEDDEDEDDGQQNHKANLAAFYNANLDDLPDDQEDEYDEDAEEDDDDEVAEPEMTKAQPGVKRSAPEDGPVEEEGLEDGPSDAKKTKVD